MTSLSLNALCFFSRFQVHGLMSSVGPSFFSLSASFHPHSCFVFFLWHLLQDKFGTWKQQQRERVKKIENTVWLTECLTMKAENPRASHSVWTYLQMSSVFLFTAGCVKGKRNTCSARSRRKQYNTSSFVSCCCSLAVVGAQPARLF